MKYINTFKIYESLNTFDKFYDNWSDFVLNIQQDWSKEDLKQHFYEMLEYVKKIPGQDMYRSIFVDTKWITDFKHKKVIRVGKFWTTDKSIARNWNPSDNYDFDYKSIGENVVLLSATIPDIRNIDINATIAHNIVLSEGEVRILENTPIKVTSINTKQNIDIRGKIFLS